MQPQPKRYSKVLHLSSKSCVIHVLRIYVYIPMYYVCVLVSAYYLGEGEICLSWMLGEGILVI